MNPWKVTIRPRLDIEEQRPLLANMVQEQLSLRFGRLESSVSVTDDGVEIVIEGILARDEAEAKHKSQYYGRRAAEAIRGVRWHHQPSERIEACPLT